jgi:hypothetical protein
LFGLRRKKLEVLDFLNNLIKILLVQSDRAFKDFCDLCFLFEVDPGFVGNEKGVKLEETYEKI